MKIYTIIHLHTAGSCATPAAVLSSPLDAPLTMEDVAMVGRKLKIFDVVDTTWVSYIRPATSNVHKAGAVRSKEPRHTAVLAAHVDVLSHIPFASGMGDWVLGLHYAGGEYLSWTADDFRSMCSKFWALTASACDVCTINTGAGCRWPLLAKRLTDMGATHPERNFSDSGGLQIEVTRRPTDEQPIFTGHEIPAADSRSRYAYDTNNRLAALKRNTGAIGDVEYVSAYYTSTYPHNRYQVDQSWAQRSKSVHDIRHEPAVLRARMEKQSKIAKKAAASRDATSQLCGQGTDEPCYLLDQCDRWRRTERCTRLVTEEDFDAYVHQYFTVHPSELSDMHQLHLSTLLGGTAIQAINPDTGFEKEFTVEGCVSGSRGSVTWIISTYWQNDLIQLRSWREFKQWIRRYAPWRMSWLEENEAVADSRRCHIDTRSHYLATLHSRWRSISRFSGFGTNRYRAVGTHLTDYTNVDITDPDAVWTFGCYQAYEDGSIRKKRTLRDALYWSNMGFLTDPRHFNPEPGSRLKTYSLQDGGS